MKKGRNWFLIERNANLTDCMDSIDIGEIDTRVSQPDLSMPVFLRFKEKLVLNSFLLTIEYDYEIVMVGFLKS